MRRVRKRRGGGTYAVRPNTGLTPPASLPVRNRWTLNLFGFGSTDDEEEEDDEELLPLVVEDEDDEEGG